MRRILFILLLLSEALVCIYFSLFNRVSSHTLFYKLITFPFAQIGDILRHMSLSGAKGNICSIIIFVILSLAPMVIFFIKLFKMSFKPEDLLLILLSISVFSAVYFTINPTQLINWINNKDQNFISMLIMGLCSTFYSLLLCYVIIKIVRLICIFEFTVLLRCLKMLLVLVIIYLVYTIFGSEVSKLISDINTVFNGNIHTQYQILALESGNAQDVSAIYTNWYLIIFYVINQIPALLNILILFLVINIIDALIIDRLSDDAIIKARKLLSLCRISAIITVISCALVNITQLAIFKYILKSNFSIVIPLQSIVLILTVLILTGYFVQSNKLKRENNLFI